MNVLGGGTDITECLRIAQMIERHGELFVGRVYTPVEIDYCRSRRMATQHFAGRWAAKEAVLKAEGCGLGAPLQAFSVVRRGSDGDEWIDEMRYPGSGKIWQLVDLPCADGHAAALAMPPGMSVVPSEGPPFSWP